MLSLKYQCIKNIIINNIDIPDHIKNELFRDIIPYRTINKIKNLVNFHEYLRYLEDKENHGSEYYGTYKNINYKISRSLANDIWNGYILLNKNTFNNNEENELEEFVHGGWTAGWGFDYAHAFDYIPPNCLLIDHMLKHNFHHLDYSIYKNFDYVQQDIYKIIDEMYKLRDDFA